MSGPEPMQQQQQGIPGFLQADSPIHSYTEKYFGKPLHCGYPFITLRMATREEKQAQSIQQSSHNETFRGSVLNSI